MKTDASLVNENQETEKTIDPSLENINSDNKDSNAAEVLETSEGDDITNSRKNTEDIDTNTSTTEIENAGQNNPNTSTSATKNTGTGILKEKLDRFLKWANRLNIRFSDKVSLEFEGTSHRYGLMAKEEIKKGEILFIIPRKALLSPVNTAISQRIDEHSEWLDSTGKSLEDSSGWVPLLITLMYEYLNDESPWREYIDLLPEISEFGQPIFWTDEELDQELQGLSILDDTKQDKSNLENEYIRYVVPFVRRNTDICIDGLEKYSLELFRRMVGFIMAYSFTEFLESPPEMIPVADMLNHHSNNNAYLFYGKDYLKMNSIKKIEKGEEIFNTFGKLGNSALLQMYGYVETPLNYYDILQVNVTSIFDEKENIKDTNLPLLHAMASYLQKTGLALQDDCFIFDKNGLRSGPDFINMLKVLHMDEVEFENMLKLRAGNRKNSFYQKLLKKFKLAKKTNISSGVAVIDITEDDDDDDDVNDENKTCEKRKSCDTQEILDDNSPPLKKSCVESDSNNDGDNSVIIIDDMSDEEDDHDDLIDDDDDDDDDEEEEEEEEEDDKYYDDKLDNVNLSSFNETIPTLKQSDSNPIEKNSSVNCDDRNSSSSKTSTIIENVLNNVNKTNKNQELDESEDAKPDQINTINNSKENIDNKNSHSNNDNKADKLKLSGSKNIEQQDEKPPTNSFHDEEKTVLAAKKGNNKNVSENPSKENPLEDELSNVISPTTSISNKQDTNNVEQIKKDTDGNDQTAFEISEEKKAETAKHTTKDSNDAANNHMTRDSNDAEDNKTKHTNMSNDNSEDNTNEIQEKKVNGDINNEVVMIDEGDSISVDDDDDDEEDEDDDDDVEILSEEIKCIYTYETLNTKLQPEWKSFMICVLTRLKNSLKNDEINIENELSRNQANALHLRNGQRRLIDTFIKAIT